ncbi:MULTISPECIES: DUF2470 domain-containing protein [unclassified Pseudofrankia]|uniref:DUF2470 domain-containing protein n=1 Tax=unclassified Pseudofrankia TaxID=2994372 RepID=UPI0008D9386A|nr:MULTISPECIES: DUF2470 domain-containing protein [unclassified Pseudofrankia]MDT3444977.1 DUF2470 domain-containing protein [Pseudofrankia sp. BMG5.37]OHV68177.1 DUF2470 domain-containing protein [Pseudofrankia sp. BMG5.36]
MPAEEPDEAMARDAVRARTVLAGARHALLTVLGPRVRGWTGLIDDGGEPVLLVGADSPPTRAAAAGSARRCRLDIPGAAGERLVLAGQLRTVPGSAEQVARRIAGPGLTVEVPQCGGDELAAVALSVDEVLLCLPSVAEPGARRGWLHRVAGGAASAAEGGALGQGTEPRWPSTANGQRIDLAAYALAEPDLIAAYAPDLVEHLNIAHGDQLRRIAAHGQPVAAPVPRPSRTAGALGSTATADGAGSAAGTAGALGLGGVASGSDSGEPAWTRRLADPTDLSAVAAVAIGDLDRTGLTLWQVGQDGADELRVTFRQPLTEPRSLGLELRRLLSND